MNVDVLKFNGILDFEKKTKYFKQYNPSEHTYTNTEK